MRHSTSSTPDDGSAEILAYEQAAHPRRSGKASKILLCICITILLLAALALMYIRQYTVTGVSMEPTLMAGDRVFYVGFSEADYGDIVIFDAGDVYGLVIKRVVGLPGDTIEITQDGHLVRNGALQEEAYLIPDSLGNSAMQQITVENGKLFVLGDNRASSIDSRDVRVGQISFDSVRGVVTRMIRETGQP
jgi:signal peptidase I